MAGRVLHRLVIRRADAAEVFAVRDAEAWRLPEVELEERHTAEVEHINAAVQRRWGLTTVALFGLGHESRASRPRRTHVLAALDGGPADDDAAWMTLGQLQSRFGRDADVVLAKQALGSSPASPESPAPSPLAAWSHPNWWTAAGAWIEEQIGPSRITQTRCWESSCVARVQRGEETFFFKAVPSAAREVAVTAHLSAQRAPGAPDVVAADGERHWLLMRAFDGVCLDDTREPQRWLRAAATYGALQASTIDEAEQLRALGCPERRLEDIEAAIEPLLADRAALMIGEEEGLTVAQGEAIGRSAAALRRACAALAEARLPLALDHGDLWPSNLLVSEPLCTIIDWEDAALAPAFLSLAPYLAMRGEWQVKLDLDEIAAAYLAAFADRLPPPEARRLFDLAVPLGLFELAVRYWRVPAEIVGMHPWMREMVPFFLRHLLGARA